MANLLAILLMFFAVILQTTLGVRINILSGSVDLALLTLLSWVLHDPRENQWQWGILIGGLVGASSAIPFFIPLIGYLLVLLLVYLFQSRLWQAPILILFLVTFMGTFILNGLELTYIWLSGAVLTYNEALNLVLLPSLVLNLIIVLPIYAIIGEFAKMVFPLEVEE
jgi:cell shape-determining protein MreD